MKSILFAMTGLLALASTSAAAKNPAENTICSITGWSNDSDPNGLNVRAAPGTDAKIIGKIPPERAQGPDTYAAEFDIIGSRAGWMLIRNARFVDYGDGKGDRPIFSGPGWIYADKVRFEIEGPTLMSRPDSRSPVIARLSSPNQQPTQIDHVYGCQGKFADISIRRDKTVSRGWANNICSNQVTTCP